MDQHLSDFWWLILPLLWFVYAMTRLWLHHRARRDAMDLWRTYASQGKEPPADLVAILQHGPFPGGARSSGEQRLWLRVALLGSVALGFAFEAFFAQNGAGPDYDVLAAAVALAALAAGYFYVARYKSKPDDA
jgi:hypothetical protein